MIEKYWICPACKTRIVRQDGEGKRACPHCGFKEMTPIIQNDDWRAIELKVLKE